MKSGDLIKLFANGQEAVWCWDGVDTDYFFPNGTPAVIIRKGVELRDADPHAIFLVLCDGRAVWVHKNEIEMINGPA